jgi:hypothetical protein
LAASGPQPARVGSLLEDGLDLEADRHHVADRDATAVHRDADVDAEVASADLRGRGKASPLPAVLWMVCWSQQYDDAAPRNVRRRASLTFRCAVSSDWVSADPTRGARHMSSRPGAAPGRSGRPVTLDESVTMAFVIVLDSMTPA